MQQQQQPPNPLTAATACQVAFCCSHHWMWEWLMCPLLLMMMMEMHMQVVRRLVVCLASLLHAASLQAGMGVWVCPWL